MLLDQEPEIYMYLNENGPIQIIVIFRRYWHVEYDNLM